MISCLNGKIIEKGAGHLVVLVGGVGFEVRVPSDTLAKAPAAGEDISLFTYLHVRDDALQLYGFDSRHGRELFTRLISVSGFGAGKALSALSVFPPEKFVSVINSGDAEALTMIPGVGRKGAQRLLLEMKDKVGPSTEGAGPVPEGARRCFAEALEGLVQLGYTRGEAHEALRRFPEREVEADVAELLQFALKNMDRDAGKGG